MNFRHFFGVVKQGFSWSAALRLPLTGLFYGFLSVVGSCSLVKVLFPSWATPIINLKYELSMNIL